METVRTWFDNEGWRLEPAELRAALHKHGAGEDVIVELLDEGADRRRALPVVERERQGEGTLKPAPRSTTGNVIALREEPHNVPPQALEAEESVLGAMMVSPIACETVSELLHERDFYRQSHTLIYRAALRLAEEGKPVDAITLTDALEESGHLEDIGGRVRLHELAALVPATANVGHYAQIVKEQATLRGLIRAGGEIARMGWERTGLASDLVDEAQQITLELADTSISSSTDHVKDSLTDTFKRMQARSESGSDVVGLPTGFRDLDRVTAGLENGNLIIIAARPSMGKSALVQAIAANVAKHSGPVALFSPEMSKAELTQRLLAREAHVDLQHIRTGKLHPDEWPRISHACGTLENVPLYLNDKGDLSMPTVRSECRRLKRTGLVLVIVDYLQLMTSTGENRTQEVSKISRGLKVLARDLDVPVIALSQLSRAVEQRVDKRPVLSDLRESGTIEQDADLVAFLYRDDYYHPETSDKPGVCEINLAKHRNGPTGTLDLSFVKAEATFTDLHYPGVY